METNFNKKDAVSLKSFLIFTFFLLSALNFGFYSNSAYFRVTQVNVVSDSELYKETEFINLILGQSIWRVNDNTFSDKVLELPTLQDINIKREGSNEITLELIEYEKIISITDFRSSIPRKSILYKNMFEMESEKTFNLATLTITNGPVPTGFNGELLSLIMTLRNYELDASKFNFVYDGKTFYGKYHDLDIDFGAPSDLGSKSAALGYLLLRSECEGEIRFISNEDTIATCSKI